MAKVYALVKFTDPEGVEHEIGEGFDLPRETDLQKRDFQTLLDTGVVTQTEPKIEQREESNSEDSESSRRARRRS